MKSDTGQTGTETYNRSRDFSHIRLSYVVAFYLNQESSSLLVELLEQYAKYSPEVIDRIQFVLVDDASPIKVDIPPSLDLNILLLRSGMDIPWNQPGARNLGITLSRSEKVVVTDIDYEFPERTFKELIRRKNPGRTIYKLGHIGPEGKFMQSHPNTFFLSRSRFLKLYGYDEEFCGHYGFDDTMFWRWQRYNGTRFLHLNKKKFFARFRSIDYKKSYHSLERDLSHNRAVAERKRRAWEKYGPNAGHSRQFLQFPWSIELDRQRKNRPSAPPINKSWVKTWWLRWLTGGE